ncbi:MAG TPA: NADPH:quinone oxidoreductase family protein [Ktedonobacterales bacterium]
MKAILCREYGPPERLEYADVESPVPRAGEIILSVKACAVNFPDTLVIQGRYQFQPPMPFSPGTDIAGVVKSVGAGVTIPVPGDRVFGLVMSGGFAEEVAMPAAAAHPIPDGVDFVTAAAIQLTYGTAYHALVDRARIQPGETLLVLGAAGGVGMATIEVGKALGARVIAAASSPEKVSACLEAGADEGIDYTHEDLRERIKALTSGKGVNVALDPVGGAFAEPTLRSVAWNGRYLVIGFTAGEIPRIPTNLPLLKGSSIVGVFYGGLLTQEPALALANQRTLAEWLAAGRIKPRISATYPLREAARALEDIAERRAVGKVVLVMGD